MSSLKYHPALNAPRRIGKRILAPLVYRHQPMGLHALRLYAYLDAIVKTNHLHGAVIEVGVAMGGTAAEAWKTLERLGSDRRYLAIDTYSGYIASHFEEDIRRGLKRTERSTLFGGNDAELVRSILKRHKAEGVEVIEADICTYDGLPEAVSLCLLDVNLYEPTMAGLEKVWPRLEPGGIILIDDCGEGNDWQCRQALAEFCEKNNLPFRREFMDVGFLTKE